MQRCGSAIVFVLKLFSLLCTHSYSLTAVANLMHECTLCCRIRTALQAEVDITNRARESAVQEANKLLYTHHYSHTAASIVDADSAILWRERALCYEEQLSRLGITLAPHITTAAAASSSSGTGSSSAVKATNTLTSADFSASRKATAAAAAAAAVGGSVTKQRSSSAAHRDVVVASLACFEHSMLVQQGVSQRLEQQLSRAKQALAAAQAAAAAQTSGGTVRNSSSTVSAVTATDTVPGAATDAVIEEAVVQPDTTAATAAASETASARVQAILIANATAQAQRKAALQQRASSPNAITDTGNSSSSAGPRCEFSTAYTSAAHSLRTPNKAQLQRHQPHNSSGSGTAGAGAAGLKLTYEPKSPELRSWLAQHRAAAQHHVRTLG
jgi:hypothetical protein